MGAGTRQFAARRRAAVALMATALTVSLVGAACVAPPTGPEPPRRDPEIDRMLADPEWAAQLGETEEERAQIIEDVSAYVDEWSQWELDDLEVERWNQEKLVADAEAEAEARRAQERLDAEAAAEAERLAELTAGPGLPELQEQVTDGAEDYDVSADAAHWASIPDFAAGQADFRQRHVSTTQRVDRLVAVMQASGELERVDAIPGWVPPEGQDDPLFTTIWLDKVEDRISVLDPTGACKDRAGNRKAPTDDGLRPGTIYTPYQNTFAGSGGTPTHLGQLQTVTLGGKRHMVVEGHIGNLNTLGVPAAIGVATWFQTRISILTAENIVSDPDGYGPFRQPWVPGTSELSGRVQVLCYTDDFGLSTGSPIRRAMFRAYIPIENEEYSLVDEVFQLRAAVGSIPLNWGEPPVLFYGADQRTVHLGRAPLGHQSTFTNGGFGVTLGSGVVTDNNGIAGDDLESSLRGPVASGLVNALSALDGTSAWVLGKKKANASWGWFGFAINNSAPTTPTVDLDWVPTYRNGQEDDEFRLRGSISMKDWLIEARVSLPWAALGLVPCYVKMKVDFSASIYASVDVHDTARTVLVPNIEIGGINANVHSMFASPLPLGCNSLYLFKFVNSWVEKLQGKLPAINQNLSTNLQTQPNLPAAVPATIPIGGGQNMQALFTGWNDTCAPYGCNGGGAGDVGISWAGIEASGDFRFTDTKPVQATRRFPASYSPTTGGTANDRIRHHFGPQNEIIDFSAYVNPSLLNQMLRVLAEHGRLDGAANATEPVVARTAPLYINTPVAPDKPLGLHIPHLEWDPVGPNLLSIESFAAVGVGFDAGTRKLVPSTISPSDPGLGIAIRALRCESTLWLSCNGIPALASAAANYLGNSLLNPLLQNTVGQVKIPQTGNFSLTGVKIVNEDGHLGLRASVGASQLRAWGHIDASTYSFDTFFEGLAGTGPVTYSWVIRDGVTNAVVHTETSQQHQLGGFSTSALHPMNMLGLQLRVVTATVTATRGGQSITTTHTHQRIN